MYVIKNIFILCLFCIFNASFANQYSTKNGKISLQQATQNILSKTDGKILSAESLQHHNQMRYRFKVLTKDGRVRELTINPYQRK